MRLFILHSVQTDKFGEPIDTRVATIHNAKSITDAEFFADHFRGYKFNHTGLVYYVAGVDRNDKRTIRTPEYQYVRLENAKKKYKDLSQENNYDVYIYYRIYDGRNGNDKDTNIKYIMSHLVD